MSAELPYIRFEIVHGLLYATYQQGVILDEPTAREIVEIRKSFTGGAEMAVLIFIDGIQKITPEARRYMASAEGIEGLTAVAMVSTSMLPYVLGNFLLQVNQARIPIRIFDQQKKAESWIRSYIRTR